jgi:hypothetical protein
VEPAEWSISDSLADRLREHGKRLAVGIGLSLGALILLVLFTLLPNTPALHRDLPTTGSGFVVVLIAYFACAGAIPLLAVYGFTRLRTVKHLFARHVDRVGADAEGLWWAGRHGAHRLAWSKVEQVRLRGRAVVVTTVDGAEHVVTDLRAATRRDLVGALTARPR